MRNIGIARCVLFAVAIGAVVILFDFLNEIRESAETQQIANLRAESSAFTQDVRRIVSTTLDDVSSVGAFLESSDLVNEQEFSRFVIRSNLLERKGHVRSIAVMPLVRGENLPKFLAALDARKYVRATFGYGPTNIEKVEGRKLYAPVVYVESFEARDDLLGYDLASNPERMQVARASLQAFQPHMTPPILSGKDGEKKQSDIMIVGAVKSGGDIGMRYYLSEEADRSVLIASNFSPDIAIENLLKAYAETRFTLRISDQTDEKHAIVYETETPFDAASQVHHQKIVLGNRVWVFDYGFPGLQMATPVDDRFVFLGIIGAVAILALAIALDRLLRARGDLEQIVHDRTAELETVNEALVDAAQKASAESEAKSMFLAHMSHELRTPLNAVIGYGQMLQGQIFGEIGDKRYLDYAQTIVDAGQIQLSLVEDLLALTALESDGRDLRKTDIDIDALAQRCIDFVQTKADEENITLTLESSLNGLTLSSDERAVQQILTNLLSNAVKFTETEGEVSVRLARDRTSRTIITVQDTGIGIPEQQLDKVLQPFSRAHENSYQAHDGVGLGLSIVRGLADACGATVEIESTQGVGTAVTVTFPAISKLAEAHSDRGSNQLRGSGLS